MRGGRGRYRRFAVAWCSSGAQRGGSSRSCLLRDGARGGSHVPASVGGRRRPLRADAAARRENPRRRIATVTARASSISWPRPTWTASMSGEPCVATRDGRLGAASGRTTCRAARGAPRLVEGAEMRRVFDDRGIQYGPAFTGLTSTRTGKRRFLRCWPRLPCPGDPLAARRLWRAPGAARRLLPVRSGPSRRPKRPLAAACVAS